MALLTSILKITKLSNLPQKNNDNEIDGDGGNRNLSKSKQLKNDKSRIQTHIRATGKPIFLTPGARETFNQLKQAFTKAPILQHFDPEYHIRIETNASDYIIDGKLSYLISDHLNSDQGQWHPIAYFSKKMIPAETRYKTHNDELLAIVEAFKT